MIEVLSVFPAKGDSSDVATRGIRHLRSILMPWNQAPRFLRCLSLKRIATAREAVRSTPLWSKAALALSALLLLVVGLGHWYLHDEAKFWDARLLAAQNSLSREPAPSATARADFVSSLPPASDAAVDVAEVQRLVVASKTRVLSMQLRSSPPTASTLAVSELTLLVGGSYEAVRALMAALSQVEAQLLVSKLELRPQSAGEVEARVVLHRLGQPLKGAAR